MKTQVYALLGGEKDGKAAAYRAERALFAANGIPADAEQARTVLGKP